MIMQLCSHSAGTRQSHFFQRVNARVVDYLKLSHVDIRQPSFLSCLTLNEQSSVLFVLTCRSTVNSFTLGQLTALSLLFFALVLLKASSFSDTYAASLNYCIISWMQINLMFVPNDVLNSSLIYKCLFCYTARLSAINWPWLGKFLLQSSHQTRMRKQNLTRPYRVVFWNWLFIMITGDRRDQENYWRI